MKERQHEGYVGHEEREDVGEERQSQNRLKHRRGIEKRAQSSGGSCLLVA